MDKLTRPDSIDRAFCATLISLLKVQKQIVPALLDSLKELRILRETVKGLDPTFVDAMKVKREEANQIAAEPQFAQMRDLLPQFDEMLARLKDIQDG